MRSLITVLIRSLLIGALCIVMHGCGSKSPDPSNSDPQTDTKSAAQMTKAEFHKRIQSVFREGGAPTEVARMTLGGVCDAAQLERALGKPDKVDSDGWTWNVKDGAMSIEIESEETRDGKRMLTINGIVEHSDQNSVNVPYEQEVPDFDPKFSVEWPGTPEESRTRIAAGTIRETTMYSGNHRLFEPITIFSVTVHEFTEQSLQGRDVKEMLKSNALQRAQTPEDTVKEIEHQGFPGVDVAGRDEAAYFRRVVVLANRRMYHQAVISLQTDRLKKDDVMKFFESFAVKK